MTPLRLRTPGPAREPRHDLVSLQTCTAITRTSFLQKYSQLRLQASRQQSARYASHASSRPQPFLRGWREPIRSLANDRSTSYDAPHVRSYANFSQDIPIKNVAHESILTVVNYDSRPEISRYDDLSSWLEETLDSYLFQDDVIGVEFFGTVIIAGTAAFEPKDIANKWGTICVRSLQIPCEKRRWPAGPCIVRHGSIWPVLRLYDDVQKDFMITLRPTSDKRYTISAVD